MLHVVKLGGSLLGHPERLDRWLRLCADGGGRLVVVPGGGPFADAVRMAQQKVGVDDGTAHRMALLAMEQYGLLLAGLAPSLVLADSIAALRAAIREGRVPVWMPFRMIRNAADIEASWDVTSDSLAAWLAFELGAAALWLVKSCPMPQESAQFPAMGVVDAAFPRFCADGGFAVHVLGPADASRLAEVLARPPISPSPAAAT